MPRSDWLRDERRRLARAGKFVESACVAVEEIDALRAEIEVLSEGVLADLEDDGDDDDGDDDAPDPAAALAALKT